MSNLFKLHYEKFNVWTKDSIELKGWFVYTHLQPAKGTIFLLHGIGDSKTSMIPMAVKFASEGYNCILFDHRAHGESTGINCTFGYYEKFDYQTIIDSAIVRYPHSQPYGFFGNSLGAAITVQVMSIDRRIKAGVVQSCFGNLRETIHDYFKKITYISLPWIVDKALIETEKRIE
ncbi:MAG: alpha/beta fold hydrolase [Ignavibacteriales bacterium]|nr:alpha/beta fold hydrolase [Ignavibacteriales bacterium]